MKKELGQLKEIAVRGRMAYALACLESLAAKLDYSSPKFRELLELLWSYTETQKLADWDGKICAKEWRAVESYGLWLETECLGNRRQGSPISNLAPFDNAPKDLVGLMGLCIRIGAAHLYTGFVSDASAIGLEKVLEILAENKITPPAIERFQRNKLGASREEDDDGWGFLAPRSFYLE